MFETLGVLRLAGDLARYAGDRQAQLARNVANADTPGYRARDLAPFAESLGAASAPAMRATRPQHIVSTGGFLDWQTVDAPDAVSPNGNTVSLEDQMLKSAEVRQSHDLALAVYGQALSILRTSIGGGR
ncbi:FlgB family protein [Frigidibacter sp. ROC022]|uniref:FlgB family protein n=1 Tax=Frigidibacter sp. ROC022 TaxID=2971796 RepID=UPI00215A9A5E|nr:FlgB family protein [Frigidibacter sp. ROC022]MCR8724371.1 FlgB family protein [Frigidibacter sp. ROC022]